MQVNGLRDDTTCIVVDMMPPEKLTSSIAPPRKQGKELFKNMFHKKSSELSAHSDSDCMEPDVVEELFEEGSASLAHRLE